RPPGVKFLCAYTYLPAESEHLSIGKSCGGVGIDCCGIDFIQEILDGLIIGCGDYIRMPCGISVDMVDCRLIAVDNFHGDLISQVFFAVIRFCGGHGFRNQAACLFIPVNPDTGFEQCLPECGQFLICNAVINEQCLQCIAHGYPVCLRVYEQ